MANTSQRSQSTASCGRLIAMESGCTQGFDPFTGTTDYLKINFPCMPDSIELARSAEYMVVPSQVMPDGLHQYKWTNPLVIPFSFKLHAFDEEFCPNGALSLLETVALLHSFQVPLAGFGSGSRAIEVTYGQQNPAAAPSQTTQSQSVSGSGSDVTQNVTPENKMASFSPPVTLRLELITVGEQQPGIVCMGYVKDVKAKLNGPWLRGPNGARNLPTSADFDFSFVHVPGHGNDYSSRTGVLTSGVTSQAYGDDVRKKLYNTIALSDGNTIGYAGLKH